MSSFFQAGILLQDLLHGAAVSKESQDVLYGKSCALDDGFAYHYFGIYGYPFQQIFIIHEDVIGCSFDINVRIDQKEENGSPFALPKGHARGLIAPWRKCQIP